MIVVNNILLLPLVLLSYVLTALFITASMIQLMIALQVFPVLRSSLEQLLNPVREQIINFTTTRLKIMAAPQNEWIIVTVACMLLHHFIVMVMGIFL